MYLRVTDGTTTVNLVGGPFYRTKYVPKPPKPASLEYSPGAQADGGEVASVTRPHVTETCSLTVTGTSPDNLGANLEDLEQLLLGAWQYSNKKGGARVYVEYAAEDDDDVYRSELFWGVVSPGPDTLSTWVCAEATEVTVTWRRRFYWEGPETELSLSNSHGSGTGGVTVYNHYDSSNDNWVDLAAAAVGGSLPAPVRLEVTNSYNDSDRLYHLFVGHNVYSDPDNFDHVLEGEDADSPSGSGTTDTSCSNSEYKSSWALSTTQGLAFSWSLSTTLLGQAAGRWFRLLARLRGQPTSPPVYYVQPKVLFGVTVVAEYDEVQLAPLERLQDLGVVQLPPWLQGLDSDLYSVDLNLYARVSAGTPTLDLDFLQLTPTDSYRVLSPRGYGVSYDNRLVDDGVGGWTWVDGWSGTQKAGYYFGLGEPVHLVPGRDQRLVFLGSNNTGDAETVRTYSVRVYYRPRRATV